MYSAEEFEDHQTGIVNEVFHAGHQEKVIFQHLSAELQLLLSSIEIKVNIKAGQELCDGVTVGVVLLLDHFHEVLRG